MNQPGLGTPSFCSASSNMGSVYGLASVAIPGISGEVFEFALAATAGNQNRHVGVQRAQLRGDFVAGSVRQAQVDDDRAQILHDFSGAGQCFGSGGRLLDPEAGILEHINCKHAHEGLVLNDQHAPLYRLVITHWEPTPFALLLCDTVPPVLPLCP